MPVIALGIAPLRGKAVIFTAAPPTFGDCNVYSTNVSGGPLGMTLPPLNAGTPTVGAMMLLEKDPNDTSGNALTFDCYAGDSFTDGSTSLVLTAAGAQRTIQVVEVGVGGAVQWQIIGGLDAPATPVAPTDSDEDDESDESPVDPYILTADQTAAMEGTRFAQQLPAGTGYGGYGDGAYGYGQ